MTNYPYVTPRGILTAVTANTTATAGKHLPVNAAGGAITITLPALTAANAGAHLSIEKTETSTNVVSITGSIKGATATITMPVAMGIEFIADAAGSWWPTANNLGITVLDARYGSGVTLPTQTTASGSAFTLVGHPLTQQHLLTLTANATFTMPALTAGYSFYAKLIQGTGAPWTHSFAGAQGTNYVWAQGYQPLTISTVATHYDTLYGYCDGGPWQLSYGGIDWK